MIEVYNPTDYDTELYSTDYDKKYLEDEAILNDYEDFETNEQIFMNVRNPGDDIWPSI